MTKKKTKERLLDVAEMLYADLGISLATGRMITAKADANVSAIKFHFGSLKSLTDAVLARRLIPLAEKRLCALHRLKERSVGTPSSRHVLIAFLIPVIELSRSSNAGERAFVKILNRSLFESSSFYSSILREHLVLHLSEFFVAFQEAIPDLSSEELIYRLDFAIGAVGHAFADTNRRGLYLNKLGESEDTEALVSYLVTFLDAGFRAPKNDSILGLELEHI